MRVQFSTLVFLAGWTFLFSCATSRPPRSPLARAPNAKKSAPIAKAGQKTPQHADGSPQSAQNDHAALFQRLNDPASQPTDDDVRAAMALHPAPGTLEEAIVVSTQLRLFKIQVDQKSSFQTRDLYDAQSAATTPQGPSMEKYFSDLGLNLTAAFKNNGHLQNASSLALGHDLLARTRNSPEFDAQLKATLEAQSARLAGAVGASPSPLAPTPGTEGQMQAAPVAAVPPSAAGAVPPPAETVAIAASPAAAATDGTASDIHQIPAGEVKTGPTDIKRTDALLMQAQRMADKGEFKQAIDSVARIESKDPFFEQAREKIRVYSNRAVQDLRQKAAQAFQNAMPLNDYQAKQAYLIQAKALLEKALQDYPSAEQLETVKENLAVITRDLDTIAKDSAPDGAPKSQ